MPRIFDNIETPLLPALQETLDVAKRADFCVGYFNLRGWRHLADYADKWAGGEGACCRLLVGMHITPSEELRQALRDQDPDDLLDNQTANREKQHIAQEFRDQLTFGAPSDQDEIALQRLAKQLRQKRLFVKVYLRQGLHAKLYLLHRQDPASPIVGYLGSSNLTLAGLSKQGELNVDVLDTDATEKLAKWFQDRWQDRWCMDISDELAEILEQSWAREEPLPPYHVYLKMAYHLAQDARSGLAEFRTPQVFGDELLDFQVAAVKLAAHHLHNRGGVLLGDVVGLGKSIMATALAKLFEEGFHTETLIICPKNLVPMWEDYAYKYKLAAAKVLSISKVLGELPEKTRRYRVVLIDESHNLRNKDSKRWRVIREYIERNDSRCILLSATPYNKTYKDLAAQLGLFLHAEQDLGIRPEALIKKLQGEHHFMAQHQCPVQSIAAFEKSEEADDWRDLMRHYMVRRTRSFINRHYAKKDRKGAYLEFANGDKSYFPKRVPKTLEFKVDEKDPADPYARLHSNKVVDAINSLELPRYGLARYLKDEPDPPRTATQEQIAEGLSRAGNQLRGFCRINLFKRLESAGPAFLLSIERHILRNHVFIYAMQNGLDIPIGSQNAEWLDNRNNDEDLDDLIQSAIIGDDDNEELDAADVNISDSSEMAARAKDIYTFYRSGRMKNRFKWLPCHLFEDGLVKHLADDAQKLTEVLEHCGDWNPAQDSKLATLATLVSKTHSKDKVLIFTQFADTARYLGKELRAKGIEQMQVVTGDSDNPAAIAWRFSPVSNDKHISKADELRVLVSTDVLSEGQNLQDCALVVNYDLPWAIIRLIQRVGRVDRIGQQSREILSYSFMPAEGVERIIDLRSRIRARLAQNEEVVGSDETFFDDEGSPDSSQAHKKEAQTIRDLYSEKAGILDEQSDAEVDLASYAYQIWKDAIDADPELEKTVAALPNVVYATKAHQAAATDNPKGALVYMRTAQNNDALAWIDEKGESVTQSQLAILQAAACSPSTKALPRSEKHHALTQKGMRHIINEERSFGGALGRPSGARFKTYERLKQHRAYLDQSPDLLSPDRLRHLDRVLEDLLHHPLTPHATDTLNNHLKTGIPEPDLADLALDLREQGRLCVVDSQQEQRDAKLICSMGLV